MSRSRLRVAVQRAVDRHWLPEAAEIRRWAQAAAGEAYAGELTVRIVDEAESASLNETYRGKSGPTNVLAFPADIPSFPADDAEPLPLGDLVICAPVVEREAAEQGKTLTAHFAHLVVHGTLHLIGHDHEEEAAARAMEDREREVLGAFGFGDPYRVEDGA